MRSQVTVVSADGAHAQSVVVDVDPATPVEAVFEALGHAAGLGGVSVTDLAVGGAGLASPAALDPAARWDAAGVVDGSILELGATPGLQHPSGPTAETFEKHYLLVTGGRGAGTIYAADFGKLSLGSDPGCTIVLDDAPGFAAVVEVTERGVAVRRADKDTDVSVNGVQVTEVADWAAGDTVRIHDVVLELTTDETSKASLKPSEEPGRLDYNRPPRLFPPARETAFRLPGIPGEEGRRSFPVVMMVAPLLLSVGIAIMMRRPEYLLFGLLSPVMMMASHFSGRKTGKLSHRERLAKYRQTKQTIEADVKAAVTAFENEQRLFNPDPATAAMIALTPSPRLWERRRIDPDHLSLRLGVSSGPSDVSVEDPEQVEHRRKVVWDAHDVPVTVSLAERGVVGLCGPDEQIGRLAAWGLAQLAITQSPRDVQLVVLTSPERAAVWEWVRWLPHARGGSTVGLVGVDPSSLTQRINELSQTIDSRLRDQVAAGGKDVPGVDIVVVLDGARRLRSWPGVAQVLSNGPAARVFSLCLDTEERLLPEECAAVLAPAQDGKWVLRQQRAKNVDHILLDTVPAAWFDPVARALAPIRDASDDSDAALPGSARLLDVLGLEPPTAQKVISRWQVRGRSTTAILGVSLEGAFAVDVRRDGPHSLFAGTTGAGKSELLQTLVASLAVANRPDEMTFILVDYKGGAAFKDFATLPHTVGIVTDLDTHLVERAMDSLAAELRRREHQLAAVGAKDIEDYVILSDRDRSLPKMPRLMMVIDEFAAMKAELPDFVTGVVNIAQRGRSLGIHLVLATQRPGGAITADIRANTNLRIALRVADPGESSEIIAAPDAAKISKDTPGRGFLRSGAAPLVPFQTGRIGGLRPSTVTAEIEPPHIVAVPWERLGEPLEARTKKASDQEELTDLVVLIEQITQAAQQLAIPVQPSPWLPALPAIVTLDQIVGPAGHGPEDGGESLDDALAPIVFGLEDLPALQLQRPLSIDLNNFSHLYLCGSARSGRSQALRTIAGSIGRVTSIKDVHLYGMDFGNGGLMPVADLPHCGAVVTRTQAERVERLVDRLLAQLARRQQLLAASGFATITEQRAVVAVADRLPHIVVLFDQWEGFMATLGESGAGILVEHLTNLLREGAPAGIHFIITGDKQLLNPRTSSLVERKLILRFADRNDYTMAGLHPRKMPETIPEGRTFTAERGIEAQIALLSPETTGQAQATALRNIAANAESRSGDVPPAQRPFRLEALPVSVGFHDAWASRPDDAPIRWAMIGIGGDNLSAVGTDLNINPTFLVAGPSKSGRSTALMSLCGSLLEQGAPLIVATPRTSRLETLQTHPGVRALRGPHEITAEALNELIPAGTAGATLVIDDAEALTDPGARDWLRAYVKNLRSAGNALLVGAHIDDFGSGIFSGWEIDVKNNRIGALIAPTSSMQGHLIGASLNKTTLNQPMTPGRAIVNNGTTEIITVQIPLA